jgi:ethanolamine ammonia-lyase large subunit
MGVPGADDVMLSYQSSSFHDALYLRRVLGKKPAPEFSQWLERTGLADRDGNVIGSGELPALMAPVLGLIE